MKSASGGKKILLSLFTLAVVVGAGIAATRAYFSDTETSKNNVLQAGYIDLKVSNTSYYNGVLSPGTTWTSKDLETGNLFFNFTDLKPGDLGEDTIDLEVKNNPAWACMNVKVTSNDENVANEPELSAGDQADSSSLFDGELAQNLNFIFWTDDGDNVFEKGETGKIIWEGTGEQLMANGKWVLADSQKNNVGGTPGKPLDGQSTYNIGKAWCFGNLTKAPVDDGNNSPTVNPGVTCDGSGDLNMAQTDKLTADLIFTAIQERHNSKFTCENCLGGSAWASQVIENKQGTRKDGSPVLPERSSPNNALGAPDSPQPIVKFFSLGFGGSLTIAFAQPAMNVSGSDLSFHETTWGSYPLEKADVYVSQDNVTYTFIGTVDNTGGGVKYLDFGSTGYDWVKYIKIVDTSDKSLFTNEGDGYDLDAIDAVQLTNCMED